MGIRSSERVAPKRLEGVGGEGGGVRFSELKQNSIASPKSAFVGYRPSTHLSGLYSTKVVVLNLCFNIIVDAFSMTSVTGKFNG